MMRTVLMAMVTLVLLVRVSSSEPPACEYEDGPREPGAQRQDVIAGGLAARRPAIRGGGHRLQLEHLGRGEELVEQLGHRHSVSRRPRLAVRASHAVNRASARRLPREVSVTWVIPATSGEIVVSSRHRMNLFRYREFTAVPGSISA